MTYAFNVMSRMDMDLILQVEIDLNVVHVMLVVLVMDFSNHGMHLLINVHRCVVMDLSELMNNVTMVICLILMDVLPIVRFSLERLVPASPAYAILLI